MASLGSQPLTPPREEGERGGGRERGRREGGRERGRREGEEEGA